LSKEGRRRQYMPLLAVQTPLYFHGMNVPIRDAAKSKRQYSFSRLQLEPFFVCKVFAQSTSSVVHAAVSAKSRAEISESTRRISESDRSCAVSSASCCAACCVPSQSAIRLHRRLGGRSAMLAGPSCQLTAWGPMDACTPGNRNTLCRKISERC